MQKKWKTPTSKWFSKLPFSEYCGRETLLVVCLIVVILLVAYFGVVYMKNLNYHWFYEDNVRQTIQDMVKSGALK